MPDYETESPELRDKEIDKRVDSVDNITLAQNAQLKSLIRRNKHIFRKEPGRSRSYEHTFILKNQEPFFGKSYPIPIKYCVAFDLEMKKILQMGVIERSTSPYINPMVVVIKKDQSIRSGLDARTSNENLQDDHDGPEDMEDILQNCSGGRVISSFDITKSFWHIGPEKKVTRVNRFYASRSDLTSQGRTFQHED